MKNINRISLSVLLITLITVSCQKMSQPELGNYPPDTNVPGGPLKFYAAFDGTTSNPSMNAVDSIRANFASSNPLTTVDGIRGKAVQGVANKAISWGSANDFKNSTSFTIAFWVKRAVNNSTEFYFSLKDDTYSWSHSAMFMMVEHGSATEATVKVYVMDQWMEFNDQNKMQKPLLDGNWHHFVIQYDETTSKMAYYFDGAVVANPPAAAVDVKKNGSPRGKLDFSKANSLIIGGANKHADLAGLEDGWISNFGGAIDQFRMYSTVLTAAEINSLYTNKL